MKQKRLFIIFLFLSTLFINSCGSMMYTERSDVEVENDQYEQHTRYLGVTDFNSQSPQNFGITVQHYLRSFVHKETGQTDHQAYIYIIYAGDWAFFERAAFEGGDQADLMQLSSDVVSCGSGSCWLSEVVAVPLSTERLLNNRQGINLKLFSQKGHEFIVSITSKQIDKHIIAMGLNNNGETI